MSGLAWHTAAAHWNDPHSPFRLVRFDSEMVARTYASYRAPYALMQSNTESPFNSTSVSCEYKYTKLPLVLPLLLAQLSMTFVPGETPCRYAQPPLPPLLPIPNVLAVQLKKESLRIDTTHG
jgi:hypothetical protein